MGFKRFGSLLLSFTLFTLSAQVEHEELARYKKKYPEMSAVNTRVIDEIVIDINKVDSIIITTKGLREQFYLDKNASRYSERSVSSGFFYKLLDIEAKVLIPSSSTKYKTIRIKDFVEEKAINESIFYDGNTNTKFVLNDLKEGAKSIIKETYEIKEPRLLPMRHIGSYINTEYQELQIKVNKAINLRFEKFNWFDTITTYSKSEKGDYVTHIWKAKDLEPIKSEPSAPTLRSYMPHIYPVIQSYTVKGVEIPVLRDVDDLHAWYEALISKVNLEEVDEIKVLVDSLMVNKNTDAEKVQTIFEWVQKNIKYVAYEDGLGGFVPRDPSLVFTRKYGDCKDVSFLQVYMANLAGVKVYPAWVGTRDIPYSYKELASPGCDNHMIGAFERGPNDWLFLDATGTYSNYGFPSAFFQGKEILIHKGPSNYEIVTASEVESNKSRVDDKVVLKIDELDLKGVGEVSFYGFILTNMKYRLLESDSLKTSKYLKSYLEKGSNKFFFEMKEKNLNDAVKGTVNYGFTVKDYVKKNDDDIYVNLNLSKIFSDEKIDKDRKQSIELDYKQEMNFEFKLDIDSYVIDYLPENSQFNSDEFSYAITYEQIGSVITYRLNVRLNHLLLKKEKFEEWNKMIKSLNRSYKEVIVLKDKK